MKIEETFQAKIQKLQPWFSQMIGDIKKDVKTELFRAYPKIYQRHFSKMYFAKCSLEDLAAPLLKEVLAGDNDLGEWLASKWIVKNGDIYQFFASKLMQINPKFDQIEALSEAQSEALIKDAVARYGAIKSYIFSVLNSVAFTPAAFDRLAALAKDEANG